MKNKFKKVIFFLALTGISTLNPSCRHGSQDAQAAYKRYALRNVILISKKQSSHD